MSSACPKVVAHGHGTFIHVSVLIHLSPRITESWHLSNYFEIPMNPSRANLHRFLQKCRRQCAGFIITLPYRVSPCGVPKVSKTCEASGCKSSRRGRSSNHIWLTFISIRLTDRYGIAENSLRDRFGDAFFACLAYTSASDTYENMHTHPIALTMALTDSYSPSLTSLYGLLSRTLRATLPSPHPQVLSHKAVPVPVWLSRFCV